MAKKASSTSSKKSSGSSISSKKSSVWSNPKTETTTVKTSTAKGGNSGEVGGVVNGSDKPTLDLGKSLTTQIENYNKLTEQQKAILTDPANNGTNLADAQEWVNNQLEANNAVNSLVTGEVKGQSAGEIFSNAKAQGKTDSEAGMLAGAFSQYYNVATLTNKTALSNTLQSMQNSGFNISEASLARFTSNVANSYENSIPTGSFVYDSKSTDTLIKQLSNINTNNEKIQAGIQNQIALQKEKFPDGSAERTILENALNKSQVAYDATGTIVQELEKAREAVREANDDVVKTTLNISVDALEVTMIGSSNRSVNGSTEWSQRIKDERIIGDAKNIITNDTGGTGTLRAKDWIYGKSEDFKNNRNKYTVNNLDSLKWARGFDGKIDWDKVARGNSFSYNQDFKLMYNAGNSNVSLSNSECVRDTREMSYLTGYMRATGNSPYIDGKPENGLSSEYLDWKKNTGFKQTNDKQVQDDYENQVAETLETLGYDSSNYTIVYESGSMKNSATDLATTGVNIRLNPYKKDGSRKTTSELQSEYAQLAADLSLSGCGVGMRVNNNGHEVAIMGVAEGTDTSNVTLADLVGYDNWNEGSMTGTGQYFGRDFGKDNRNKGITESMPSARNGYRITDKDMTGENAGSGVTTTGLRLFYV